MSFFLAFVRMRLGVAAIAFVATLQCYVGVSAAAEPPNNVYVDAAAKKAVQEVVAVPIGLLWKDLYEALVHNKGPKAYRRLRFLTAGLFGKNEPLELTYFLMDKLKKEVFSNSVNRKIWDILTMELYFALKEWWMNTPENPKDAADLGAWHAMVRLYKDILAPTLRGSHRVGSMNEILLDPELANIKRWVDEWKGVPRHPSKETSAKEEKASTAGTD